MNYQQQWRWRTLFYGGRVAHVKYDSGEWFWTNNWAADKRNGRVTIIPYKTTTGMTWQTRTENEKKLLVERVYDGDKWRYWGVHGDNDAGTFQ